MFSSPQVIKELCLFVHNKHELNARHFPNWAYIGGVNYTDYMIGLARLNDRETLTYQLEWCIDTFNGYSPDHILIQDLSDITDAFIGSIKK